MISTSLRLKSFYIARFLLDVTGILLALFAAFALLVVPRGFHGERPHAKWIEGTIVFVAIGFLLPQISAKFISSLFLLGTGIWLFHTDAYWQSNLGIYSLFLAPLAITLWLRAGYNDLNIQRLPNGN